MMSTSAKIRFRWSNILNTKTNIIYLHCPETISFTVALIWNERDQIYQSNEADIPCKTHTGLFLEIGNAGKSFPCEPFIVVSNSIEITLYLKETISSMPASNFKMPYGLNSPASHLLNESYSSIIEQDILDPLALSEKISRIRVDTPTPKSNVYRKLFYSTFIHPPRESTPLLVASAHHIRDSSRDDSSELPISIHSHIPEIMLSSSKIINGDAQTLMDLLADRELEIKRLHQEVGLLEECNKALQKESIEARRKNSASFQSEADSKIIELEKDKRDLEVVTQELLTKEEENREAKVNLEWEVTCLRESLSGNDQREVVQLLEEMKLLRGEVKNLCDKNKDLYTDVVKLRDENQQLKLKLQGSGIKKYSGAGDAGNGSAIAPGLSLSEPFVTMSLHQETSLNSARLSIEDDSESTVYRGLPPLDKDIEKTNQNTDYEVTEDLLADEQNENHRSHSEEQTLKPSVTLTHAKQPERNRSDDTNIGDLFKYDGKYKTEKRDKLGYSSDIRKYKAEKEDKLAYSSDESSSSTDALIDATEVFLNSISDYSSVLSIGAEKSYSKSFKTSFHGNLEVPIKVRTPIIQAKEQPFIPRSNSDLRSGYHIRFMNVHGRMTEGIVRYTGPLIGHVNPLDKFVGVELDTPAGNSDGTFNGQKYFTCRKSCGVFIPFRKVVLAWEQKPKQ